MGVALMMLPALFERPRAAGSCATLRAPKQCAHFATPAADQSIGWRVRRAHPHQVCEAGQPRARRGQPSTVDCEPRLQTGRRRTVLAIVPALLVPARGAWALGTLPCSGGDAGEGCLGSGPASLEARRGVSRTFIDSVDLALERAVVAVELMPLKQFKREKARIALATSAPITVAGGDGGFVPYQLALRAVRGAQGEAPQEALPGTASAAPPDALNASLYAAYTVAGERVRDLEQRFSFSGGDIVARFQAAVGRELAAALLEGDDAPGGDAIGVEEGAGGAGEEGEEGGGAPLPPFVAPLKEAVDDRLLALLRLGYLAGYTSGPGLSSWAAGYFVVQVAAPGDLWAAARLRSEPTQPPGLYPHLAASLVEDALVRGAGAGGVRLDETFGTPTPPSLLGIVRSNPPPWAAAAGKGEKAALALMEFKFEPPM